VLLREFVESVQQLLGHRDADDRHVTTEAVGVIKDSLLRGTTRRGETGLLFSRVSREPGADDGERRVVVVFGSFLCQVVHELIGCTDFVLLHSACVTRDYGITNLLTYFTLADTASLNCKRVEVSRGDQSSTPSDLPTRLPERVVAFE
jgi:hypothetical protein